MHLLEEIKEKRTNDYELCRGEAMAGRPEKRHEQAPRESERLTEGEMCLSSQTSLKKQGSLASVGCENKSR